MVNGNWWVENAVLILISARVGKNGKPKAVNVKGLQPKILVEEKVECEKVCVWEMFGET